MSDQQPGPLVALAGEAKGYGLITLSETVSTNQHAASLASSGHDKVWVVAERQTAGRGSRGRSWSSMDGNLFASLLLQDPAEPVHFHEMTFVASLAVRAAILELSGGSVDSKLKWPNDVLISGKKCAGILLEGSETRLGRYVVVGIGVNCRRAPEQTTWPATSLLDTGIDVNKETVFDCLASCFARLMKIWDRGKGFPALREEWLNNAYGLGETARVLLPGNAEPFEGRFASVDAKGYMVLETITGETRSISAGDIFFTDNTQQG